MAKKLDVLVIGGGIIGICTALELQKSGRQVVLIDRGEPGQGCSYGNAGWITPCFAMPLPQPGMFLKSIGWLLDPGSPLYIKPALDPMLLRWLWHFTLAMNQKRFKESIKVLTAISKYSLDFYEAAGARTQDMGFEKKGLLLVSSTADGLRYAQTEMRVMAEQGIAGRFMEQEELLKFEPALRPIVKGGVFFPDEAHAEPYKMVTGLAAEFIQAGGQILAKSEVYDFVVSGSKITEVVTTQDRLSPELVVMATGSWSPEVGKRLGLDVPIMGGKGYSMSVRIQNKKPQRPIMIVERKIAITPRADSVRLAGTLELVNQDFSITPRRVRAIQEGAKEFLHMDGAEESLDLWRGLRPCTPDGVPLIGFAPKIENLFLCTGHQMLGLQSAPGSARLAADLILKRTPLTDPQPFRVDRF
jgi:D-amino-acid dehydrogenase